jgi:glycosyltransferase involved in cell wall biosynthesis
VTERVPLSVIVPCYNEQAGLSFLAETLEKFARGPGQVFELTYILVDDGSSDRTWELLQRHFPPGDRHILLQHPVNQGIGGAIITGFRAAATPYVAVIDSDCTFHPDQLSEMITLFTPDIQVVVSSPLHAGGEMQNVPRWRQAMSYGAAFLYRLMLKQELSSYTSCFRIFRLEALQGLRLSNYGFSGVTEILVRLDFAGQKFVEYPAVLGTRAFGVSKINTLRTIGDHLKMLSMIVARKGFGYRFKDLPLPRVEPAPSHDS